MPLQATSGAASYDAFGGGVAAVPTYIEEIFGTFLYTGNGSTQTINNGIDLAGKGGLYWWKVRNIADQNILVDTTRGANKYLLSNSAGAEQTTSAYNFAFNSNGVSFNNNFQEMNQSGNTYASWTFREQPKFFDVVTWTGDGTNPRQISHNLGSVPGCIIVKSTTRAENWTVYHRSLGNTGRIALNTTAAAVTGTGVWASTTPTSTTFTVSADNLVNFSGDGYVAYLFAHNAGGFGLTGTDNVISCGSYTGNGSTTGPVVNLGYEPQWVMVKRADSTGEWLMFDVMRSMSVTGSRYLEAQSAAAEGNIGGPSIVPTATGFQLAVGSAFTSLNASGGTYIYIAIRRGPMKVPTTGTSVYNAISRTGTSANATLDTVGFPPDLAHIQARDVTMTSNFQDRLRGPGANLRSEVTTQEQFDGSSVTSFGQNGVTLGADGVPGWFNRSPYTYINHFFRRAPGFFDEVCYTGTGSAMLINHNLGVPPELIITKRRNATSTLGWIVSSLYWFASTPWDRNGRLNQTNALSGGGVYEPASSHSATQYPVSAAGSDVNASGGTYVAYLFASCPGVSKVGSYTGNGSSQTINCGFTGGARFVMIKRTDSTGDWYVWDTARGIVSGNDPHLSLNTTAAEVTSNDTIDTDSTGFVVNQVSATNVNVSSATYIFLAIA